MTKLHAVAESFREQSGFCRIFGSPFTADLLHAAAAALDRGGLVRELLADWAGDPRADVLPLRLAGALHAAVLGQMDAALSSAYPSVGRAGDGVAAWHAAESFIERRRDWVADRLQSPPQTNEVRRSAALMAGLLVLAEEYRLPFALFEPGASGGLNLQLDAFSYRNAAWRWGSGDDLLIETAWTGPPPPAAPFEIAFRAGCDRNPVDASSAEDCLRLASYIWADQADRLDLLQRGLAIARRRGMVPDKADAAEWLEQRLPDHRPGLLTIVYHSIFYQYPPAATRARIEAAISAAGRAATLDSPLAWLRFEPEAVLGGPAASKRTLLDVVTWPGGRRRILAEVDPHGRSVHWFAAPPD
jgi:hypothetical protein